MARQPYEEKKKQIIEDKIEQQNIKYNELKNQMDIMEVIGINLGGMMHKVEF